MIYSLSFCLKSQAQLSPRDLRLFSDVRSGTLFLDSTFNRLLLLLAHSDNLSNRVESTGWAFEVLKPFRNFCAFSFPACGRVRANFFESGGPPQRAGLPAEAESEGGS